jgi:hypothetical protein
VGGTGSRLGGTSVGSPVGGGVGAVSGGVGSSVDVGGSVACGARDGLLVAAGAEEGAEGRGGRVGRGPIAGAPEGEGGRLPMASSIDASWRNDPTSDSSYFSSAVSRRRNCLFCRRDPGSAPSASRHAGSASEGRVQGMPCTRHATGGRAKAQAQASAALRLCRRII